MNRVWYNNKTLAQSYYAIIKTKQETNIKNNSSTCKDEAKKIKNKKKNKKNHMYIYKNIKTFIQ